MVAPRSARFHVRAISCDPGDDLLSAMIAAADLVIECAPVMDMVGLDVVRDIEMVYYRESGDASDAPSQLLLDKIAREELGVKTGKGFYRYPHPAFQTQGWPKGDED